jgi:hypothetical protein
MSPKKRHIHYQIAGFSGDTLLLHGFRLAGDYVPVCVARVKVRRNSPFHLALVNTCPMHDPTRN